MKQPQLGKNHRGIKDLTHTNMKQKENSMKNKKDTQQLATLVYVLAMRKEIEKEVESRYSKRIEYLVGANNELMKELEHLVGELRENEIITVSKESVEDIEEGGDELLHEEGGGVHDGNGLSEDDKQEYDF